MSFFQFAESWTDSALHGLAGFTGSKLPQALIYLREVWLDKTATVVVNNNVDEDKM